MTIRTGDGCLMRRGRRGTSIADALCLQEVAPRTRQEGRRASAPRAVEASDDIGDVAGVGEETEQQLVMGLSPQKTKRCFVVRRSRLWVNLDGFLMSACCQLIVR